MDVFLMWLEKYKLLIELLITVLTVFLSLYAVFQTRIIAKRQLKQEEHIAAKQSELQEKQIRISLYEQKNEINKALNTVFDIAGKLSLLYTTLKLEKLSQEKLHELFCCFVEDVDVNNISYTLEQSRFFLEHETSLAIRTVKVCFMSVTTSIRCFEHLKENEDSKTTILEEIRAACLEIEELQPKIETDMIHELELY